MPKEPVERTPEQFWRAFLEGTDPSLIRLQRWFRGLPSAPRCKMCSAPFGRPGSLFVRPLGYRRWPSNPTLCTICARGLDKQPGGAEVHAAFLFADIRGSTTMAERLSPGAYHDLLQRFYHAAERAIDDAGGLLDKYLGDGVVALFVPVFTQGTTPEMAAITAGRAILRATGHGPGETPWLPVGVGVHAGLAFVGVLGTPGGQNDFTGVGDTVNAAARLGSVAEDGELLVSVGTAAAARVDVATLERRTLDLKGRAEPIEVLVLHSSEAAGNPP